MVNHETPNLAITAQPTELLGRPSMDLFSPSQKHSMHASWLLPLVFAVSSSATFWPRSRQREAWQKSANHLWYFFDVNLVYFCPKVFPIGWIRNRIAVLWFYVWMSCTPQHTITVYWGTLKKCYIVSFSLDFGVITCSSSSSSSSATTF